MPFVLFKYESKLFERRFLRHIHPAQRQRRSFHLFGREFQLIL